MMDERIESATPGRLRYLAFDGGDTVVKVMPEFSGPMYKWPQVIAVSGIHTALEALKARYSLVVVTNAAESDAKQIRLALQRCELDHYFDHIFTPKELGFSKPQLEFFHHIEHSLNICPKEIAMIGDSYVHDISGAFRAGWKSIWFNPEHTLCPGLTPFHSAEINHMHELVNQLNHLELPQINQCLALLAEYGTSFNILQHVQAVAAAAYVMASWLKRNGIQVNPILAHRGGLLHDLAKLLETPGAKNHGELAADILNRLGQHLLAGVARRHLLSKILDEQDKPQTWEEKTVYLADKLVEGSQIVPVHVRLSALKQRYGIDSRYDGPLRSMHDELCSLMGISPHQFFETMQSIIYTGGKR